MDETLVWYKVAEMDELEEGRVKTAMAGNKAVALIHIEGRYSCMDNHCPHQGGPLGEGSIERGVDGRCWLRCPWHGWDFDPLTGLPPGGHEDTGQEMYSVEKRADGIYVGLQAEPEHARTVSDVMAETMVDWGIKRVFGMVGHSNLGLADAIRRRENDGEIGYFGIRHECAAAFACSGYGKLTGRPAACLTIAGPGATNLLTGLWDAKVDRAPVLALTGQVQVQVLGPGVFQDINLASAFQAVARFSQTVLESSQHGELMALACKNALIYQDVAHLIFPDNVQPMKIEEDAPISPAKGRMGQSDIIAPEETLLQAARWIEEAKRPMIIVGHGALEAMDAITALAEKLNAPVATTFKGKGMISDRHPCAAGVLGRSGTPVASWFMNEADLLLVFGSSFSDHTGIEPSKRIIQIDRDPIMLAKTHPVDLPIWGGCKTSTDRLCVLVKKPSAKNMRDEIAKRKDIWKKEKMSRVGDNLNNGIASAALFASLTRTAPEDAIITVDVGNNTYSFGRYFECHKQRVLMSGYLGSIGFSFPAAIGAYAATLDFPEYKGRKVISISGDGGFGQYMAEFTTAVKYGMDITHILLHNGQLGKISKEQRAGSFPVWQTSLSNPSFSAFARNCGGFGRKVTDADTLDEAIKEALDFKGPALVEVMTDAELI